MYTCCITTILAIGKKEVLIHLLTHVKMQESGIGLDMKKQDVCQNLPDLLVGSIN